MENLLTDGDSPQICTKEEMQEYSKANRLMRSGQYDQAIQLFVDHAQASWPNQAAQLTTTGRD